MTEPTERIACFCATYLKPEMLHVYRQIGGLPNFRPVVLANKVENLDRFPVDDLVVVPRARTRALRRWWCKSVRDVPIQIYSGEARRLAEAIVESGASVLHIYFGHIGVHLLPLLRIKPVPSIVSFHGADVMVDMDKPAHRAATQEMLKRADLVLVRSHSIEAGLLELGCDPGKIRLHRTGIPLAEFPWRERSFPVDGDWHFVQACRLIEKKGLLTSLRAFATFAKRYPGSRFTIAGEGPMEGEVKRVAGELGIGDKVEVVGFLKQDALRELYYAAHFFIHPSEVGEDGNQEGVPNSMLEAMATGLPVLATHHGGIPEAVDDGVSGILVEERDDESLAAVMLELAESPDRYRLLAKGGGDAVRERFDQAVQAAKLESFYREAISASVV